MCAGQIGSEDPLTRLGLGHDPEIHRGLGGHQTHHVGEFEGLVGLGLGLLGLGLLSESRSFSRFASDFQSSSMISFGFSSLMS